ncbi:uncharacterized protein [Periplaneta americana]|uniref:uncharacterized protein n=1 Tax=Periplaneta americana TaxID=6978 RepID=UPI0037E8CD9D
MLIPDRLNRLLSAVRTTLQDPSVPRLMWSAERPQLSGEDSDSSATFCSAFEHVGDQDSKESHDQGAKWSHNDRDGVLPSLSPQNADNSDVTEVRKSLSEVLHIEARSTSGTGAGKLEPVLAPRVTRQQTRRLRQSSSPHSATPQTRRRTMNVWRRLYVRVADVQEEVQAWLGGWGPCLDQAHARRLVAELQQAQATLQSGKLKHQRLGEMAQVCDKLLHQLHAVLSDETPAPTCCCSSDTESSDSGQMDAAQASDIPGKLSSRDPRLKSASYARYVLTSDATRVFDCNQPEESDIVGQMQSRTSDDDIATEVPDCSQPEERLMQPKSSAADHGSIVGLVEATSGGDIAADCSQLEEGSNVTGLTDSQPSRHGIEKIWLHSATEFIPNQQLPADFWGKRETPLPADVLAALEGW